MIMNIETDNESRWNRNAVLTFFTLTFVLQSVILVVYLIIPFLPLQILATWTPNISAVLVLLYMIRKESGVKTLLKKWTKWRVSPKYYLAAISPFAVVGGVTVIYLALGGVSPGPELNFGFTMLLGTAILIIFTGATGEELGWRGFALPQLQSRFDALTASILIGLWWGIWHMPGWFMPGQVITPMYVFTFMLGCTVESVFIAWLVNSTNGSVLMSSIFHYSMNVSAGLFAALLGLITYEALGLMKALVYSVIAIILVIRYGRQHLSAKVSSRENAESLLR
jgi:membrane protease YdiL (CAAX protease family)